MPGAPAFPAGPALPSTPLRPGAPTAKRTTPPIPTSCRHNQSHNITTAAVHHRPCRPCRPCQQGRPCRRRPACLQMSINPQSCTKHQKHKSSPSPTAPCCDSQCTAGPLLHTPHCCAAAVPVCDRRILTRRVCSATSADSPTTAQACWYHTAGSARAATHKAPCPCAHPHTARSRPSLATPPTHSSAPHAAAVATLAYYARMHSTTACTPTASAVAAEW